MAYRIVKRTFDIVACICAAAVLLLPWLVIAIIIKIVTPGPAIYKARRVGLNGEVFTLYKFRSMYVNSGSIHSTTLRGDRRVFPFGAFLRKSKLDETPQLINILQGHMTVVGPRPEDEVNAGRLYVGKYKEILTVRPGLSSPASLYDYTHGELFSSEEQYDKEFMPKKLDVELYYVQHRNLWYDAKVIVRTVCTILGILFGKTDFKQPKEIKKMHESV